MNVHQHLGLSSSLSELLSRLLGEGDRPSELYLFFDFLRRGASEEDEESPESEPEESESEESEESDDDDEEDDLIQAKQGNKSV